MNQKELYKRTIATWGVSAQMEMAVEEAAELIHAIQRYKRDGSSEKLQAIVEEAADVEIMIGQLREMLGDKHIDEAKAFKLARLEGRLDAYDAKKIKPVKLNPTDQKYKDMMNALNLGSKRVMGGTWQGERGDTKQLEAYFRLTEDEYDAITKGDEVVLNGKKWIIWKKGVYVIGKTKLTFTDR